MPPRPTITAFFKSINAPFKNDRWSWGAELNDGSGGIVLREWERNLHRDQRGEYAVVGDRSRDHDASDLGLQERRRHLERIREGAPSYLVICTPRDYDEKPRKIESFDHRQVLEGGELFVNAEGRACLRIVGRRSVFELATTR